MAKQQRLQYSLQPPSTAPSGSNASKTTQPTKRKREAVSTPHVVSDDDERPRKKSAGRQKVAKPASGVKAETSKMAKQTYQSIIKNIDKRVKELDKGCKAQGPNGRSITSDHYAAAMANFIPDVMNLSNMDGGVKFAFNLALYLGEHAHGDFYMSVKMSGYGGSEKPYKALDAIMLLLIERRKDEAIENNVQTAESASLSPVPHRWTEADANVGEFKTGWPNKQQRNQIARQRQEWMKERSEKAKEKREEVKDWVSNALGEVTDERDYLGGFGLDGYFIESIARLQELKGTVS
jgi:hypothetical protein